MMVLDRRTLLQLLSAGVRPSLLAKTVSFADPVMHTPSTKEPLMAAAQLGSDDLDGGIVAQATFPDVLAAASVKLPLVVEHLLVSRFNAESEFAPSFYQRTNNEPTHAGKLRTLDRWTKSGANDESNGGWWTILPQNGFVQAAQLGPGFKGLQRAWSVSRNVICAADTTYIFTEPLTGRGSCFIYAPRSRFQRKSPLQPFIVLQEPWLDVQPIKNLTGRSVTVMDGSVYRTSQIVKIVDDSPLPGNPERALKGEFAVIKGVAGNVVELSDDLYYSYDVNFNCRIGALSPARHLIDVGVTEDETNCRGRTIPQFRLDACSMPDVKVGQVVYSYGDVMTFVSCFGGRAQIDQILGQPKVGGYGISLTNSEYMTDSVGLAIGTRHTLDRIGRKGASRNRLSRHGAAAYNIGKDSNTIYGKSGAYAFHHGTHDNLYENCWSRFSPGWVSFRGINNGASGGGSFADDVPIATLTQANYGGAATDGSWLRNPSVKLAKTCIVRQFRPSGGVRISGGELEAGVGASDNLFELRGFGAKLIISQTRIEKSGGFLKSSMINIEDASNSEVELLDVRIDLSNVGFGDGEWCFIRNGAAAAMTLNLQNVNLKASADVAYLVSRRIKLTHGSSIGDIKIYPGLVSTDQKVRSEYLGAPVNGRVISGSTVIFDALVLPKSGSNK